MTFKSVDQKRNRHVAQDEQQPADRRRRTVSSTQVVLAVVGKQMMTHSSVRVLGIFLLLSLLAFWPGLDGDFVFDDISAVVRNADVKPNETGWTELFGNDYWGTSMRSDFSHKSYRPLTVITFRLNFWLHQLAPFGYHLGNVWLHCIVCFLFYRLSIYVLNEDDDDGHLSGKNNDNRPCPGFAFVSACLFAVHPVHVEAVVGVVGRAELLAAICYFGCILQFAQQQYFRSACLAALSLLCKEQGVTCLGICFLQLLCQSDVRPVVQRRQPWKTTTRFRSILVALGIFLLLGALLAFRFWIMGGVQGMPIFSRFDNPASVAPTPVRQLHYNYLLFLNSWLLLFPFRLCCDWAMGSIPLITGLTDPRNLLTILFYALFLCLVFRSLVEYFTGETKLQRNHTRENPNAPVLFGCALVVIPFLPATNLLQAVGFVLAERVLYLPSAGYCILIAAGLRCLCTRYPRKAGWFWAFVALVLMVFTVKSAFRSDDWKDEFRLFESGIRVNHNNAKLHSNIGHHYEKLNDYQTALQHFRKAQQLQPDDIGSMINVARTLINLGRSQPAETILWKLMPVVKQHAAMYQRRVDPNNLSLWMHLGNILSQNVTRLDEAETVYRDLIGLRGDFIDAHINLGDVLIRKGQLQKAIDVYENALRYKKREADILYNLGVVYSLQLEQARQPNAAHVDRIRVKIADLFASAITHNRVHREAMLNLAILVQRNPKLLSHYRSKLKQHMGDYEGPDEERIWFNAALLHIDEGQNQTSEFLLRKVILTRPDFASAQFNLALMLIDQKRTVEAEMQLQQLVHFHPQHSRGWALLGDLYVQFGQLDRAERCYAQVIQVYEQMKQTAHDPTDAKHNILIRDAKHNLCVVYRMQKQEDKLGGER